MAGWIEAELPDYGAIEDAPCLLESDYLSRLEDLQASMAGQYDCLLVYADREHSANLSFLTGYDPRFEEALFVFRSPAEHLLLVGLEGVGYVPYSPLDLNVEVFPDFSLLGQSREGARPLDKILKSFGLAKHSRVGVIGWKYFEHGLTSSSEHLSIEIPSYIVDLVRDLCGSRDAVFNATHLLMHPTEGLRQTNSARQIACFEYAARHTSQSLRRAQAAIKPGVSEEEVEVLLHGGGLPHSCHPMISFGDKVQMGLASPSNRRAAKGDHWVVAYGVHGALNCRAGIVGQSIKDSSASELWDFFTDYVFNYYDTVIAWYQSLKIGAVGGEVFNRCEQVRNDQLYRFAVNPGHTLHLDEWVHSPFRPGSEECLHSGMVLQMDIIPISQGPFCYTNVEDGLCLADASLRQEIAEDYPSMWQRMQKRRDFMHKKLNIELDPSVLPMSDTAGWLAPFSMSPNLMVANI